MRKVTKIFIWILAIVFAMVVLLPFMAGLALYIPGVQRFAVDQVAKIASEKLDTRVSIGSIRLKSFNNIFVDKLYIEDYRSDTLLYSERIGVEILNPGLRGATPSLGAVVLDDTKLYLHHDSAGTSNLRRILLKLNGSKEKDTTKVFRLDARSTEINNMSFRNHKNPEPRDGVNTNDIDITGFNFTGSDISVIGDSIALEIKHISLTDKSGFSVTDFSCGKFNISGSGIRFDVLSVETPDSKLHMDSLRILTGTWRGYREFIRDVRFEADIEESTLSFNTIAYFAPSLKGNGTVLRDVNCTIHGPIADLAGEFRNARTGGNTSIRTTFAIKGLPDISKTIFTLDIANLETNSEDVRSIAGDFSRKNLDTIISYFGSMNNIEVKGKFNGTLSDFASSISLNTNLGNAKVDLTTYLSKAGLRIFGGKASTGNLNMGDILSIDVLGRVNMNAGFKGVFGPDSLFFRTDTHIADVELNGYKYSDIDIVGNIDQKTFSGDVASRDDNASFDFRGLLDFTQSLPRYDFALALRRADLAKLNINRRDSVSVLSCYVDARGIGSNMDDINGQINISNLHYFNLLDSVSLGDITIIGRNDENRKYVAVNSEVMDLEFRSKMSYRTLSDYLRRSINAYIPTLASHEPETAMPDTLVSDNPNDVNNYSIVRLNIKEANNLAGIFYPGLQLASGTSLSMMVNPYANTLNFSLNSDYIERGDFFASNISLSGHNNEADSLLVYLSAKDIYSRGLHIPGINVIGGAKNNSIRLTAGYTNPDRGNSALLALTSTLERNPVNGMRQIRIRFEPSSFNSGEQNWRILSRDIVYDTTRVEIDNFRILGSGQELRIHGAISGMADDSLRMSLNNFNLGSLSDFVKITGYDVSGYANGTANIVSIRNNGSMTANMSFDSLRINRIDIPPVLFRSKWDFGRGGAGFEISRRDTTETVVRGLYRPAEKELTAKLSFGSLDMALLNPILKGVLSNNKGYAQTDLDFRIKNGRIDMDGSIDIKEYSTMVDFLNVTYSLKNTKINVSNSLFSISGASLRDPKGNSAAFNMGLDLSSLSNVRYDIRIAPRNMLVLNTSMEQNNLFYGTVFASGNATIKGDRKKIDMNISATTSDNSRFYMPLSDKSEVAVADFIAFESKRKTADTMNALMRKRMMFEGRQRRLGERGKADMNIAMNIDVRPNMDFQMIIDPEAGDMIKANGEGNLRLNIRPNNDEFTMYGDYKITEGVYHLKLKNLLDRKFTITSGSQIRWTGDPIDAALDINAIYRLKASLYPLTNDPSMRHKVPVECDIRLTDRLSQPTVLFDVRVPNADPEIQSMINYAMNTQEQKAKQFVWLAAIGSFATNDNGGFNISGNTNTIGYDMLLNQLSNLISSDKLSIGVHYTPAGEINSDEVGVDLHTQIFSDRIMLEFEGYYDTRNNSATTSNPNNLSGNFSVTWLIDPSGNLTVKGFTRTIDRFDETQGQQENGVGVYYKEDFDKFRDIIVNLRKRFSKKWRDYYRKQDDERMGVANGTDE